MHFVSDNNMAWSRRLGGGDGCITAGDCIIEATVPTGFEAVAAEEVKEVFHTQCTTVRGKITFRTPTKKVKDVLKLGGIDHCRVQILHAPSFGFTMDPADCLCRLQRLVKKSQWSEGLGVWSQFQPPSQTHTDLSLPDAMPDDQDLLGVCYSAHMPASFGDHMGKVGQRGEHCVTYKEKTASQSEDVKCGKTDSLAELLSDSCRDTHISLENASRKRIEMDSVTTQSKKALLLNKMPDTFCTETRNTKIMTAEDVDHSSKSDTSEVSRNVQRSLRDSVSDVLESRKQLTEPQDRENSTDDVKENHPLSRKPRFRVTCHRVGENHCFDSMSAAASFGRAVQAAFGWQVDLNSFDVEIVLHINDDEVSVSIALTPDSLHRRDLVALGVTTLRPTIAYNILRMVDIQPGHIVCDPLCGTSSIPIQGALRFPAFQLSGDSHRVAMHKTWCNIDNLNRRQAAQGRGGLMIDALQWNACFLPLRDGVVDAFVSDLPFGKRVGRRSDNLKLYSRVLEEMSRCSKPTGRAALLTADVRNMTKALKAQKHWSLHRRCGCNIGGLAAAVFLLHRSYVTYQSQWHHFQCCPEHRAKG